MRNRSAASAAFFCCGVLAAMPTLAAHQPPPSPRSAPTSVPTLLERMSDALRTLNYKGSFVYLHDNALEAMQVVHRADGEGGQERLTSLTGPLREVVRRHKTVECILPRKRLVVVNQYRSHSRFPMIMPSGSDIQSLGKHYRFLHLGHQRTAGRNCVVVALQPKDDYRYGYRLWLDAKSSLLLRSELIGTDGKPMDRVMFTHIEMPDTIPADAIKPTVDSSGFARRPHDPGANSVPLGVGVKIKVGTLPPGFTMTVNESQHLKSIDAPVRHLVFTDGLASLSVFAAPYTTGKDVLRGLSQRGSVNAYGRVLDGYQITVVGDVPAKTVELVAQSVQLADREEKSAKPDSGDKDP
ncbi:MAG TPA: MucB/RseB C-terminal domain-containing protein [Gammaproteobacteria bacterium]|nr:MucB/RseB C-terminal domain-containing protein [Gammaproteobacteria bacterium]